MNARKIIGVALIAILSSLIAVFVYSRLFPQKERIVVAEEDQKIRFANLPPLPTSEFNFIYAAEKSIHGVVHVKTKYTRSGDEYAYNPFYEFFFGEKYKSESTPVLASGSGVIISNDGYIVTNNHVVEKSDEIEVVLNDGRTYEAELVGSDPSTDIALLKVDEKDLPFIKYGNSDELKVGEWVLAVGNPFNLTSTVTAGIVSAKARNIRLLQGQFPIESFIQTDAAVNPGNSGGALVNTKGELVGINTAIASRTGSYSGYSFAVPVSIVKKAVKDIIEYGEVQRAILGVNIQDITAELADENGLDKIEGVFVGGVREDGAAEAVGIKEGDVILKIDDVYVNNTAELQEQVSKYRPGEKVSVLIKRDNKRKQFEIILRNMQGDTRIIKSNEMISSLGVKLRELTKEEKRKVGFDYGVQISRLESGKFEKAGIKKDFIITTIEGKRVQKVEDVSNILRGVKTGNEIEIEGIYPGGRYIYVYVIKM